MKEKYLCMDVDYRNDHAIAAGIVFDDLRSEDTLEERSVTLFDVAPYEAGAFYKRELPCLVQLIDAFDTLPDLFIVDGYVVLDETGKPGLGAYLFEHYRKAIPVIGVAKNPFRENAFAARVLRGDSQNPLYVTSLGIEQTEAARLITSMHGNHRLPTLLKKVDRNCRRAQARPEPPESGDMDSHPSSLKRRGRLRGA